MFGSRKNVRELSVVEFVTGRGTGGPDDHPAAAERDGMPKGKGWLIVATVVTIGLFALCLGAFVKIGHLNRDMALLSERVSRLERGLEVKKQANVPEAMAKTTAPAKKTRPRSRWRP